jgi:hypothetical protein
VTSPARIQLPHYYRSLDPAIRRGDAPAIDVQPVREPVATAVPTLFVLQFVRRACGEDRERRPHRARRPTAERLASRSRARSGCPGSPAGRRTRR